MAVEGFHTIHQNCWRPSQFFRIAAETKMLINAFFDQIRKIFEVHGGQMFGFILYTHDAKSPVQIIQLCKACCFG